MAKHDSGTARTRADSATVRARPKRARRQIARLQKELDRLSGQVARRTRRLTRAQAQAQKVERRLRTLRAPGAPEHHAYCLRDRRIVAILEPEAVVLGNGRPAIGGRCEACGARVVTMVPRSEAS
jgi:septal ring factor EnvC (AmiA/AmiB activator)